MNILCFFKHKWTAWNKTYERYFRSDTTCAMSGNDYVAEKWVKRSCLRCGNSQMRQII